MAAHRISKPAPETVLNNQCLLSEQIQKVSAQLELSKSAPQTVLNNQ